MESVKQHLDGKQHVIWDWNGTLLDDLDFVVEIIGALVDEHGLPPVTRQQYLELFGFPVIEYYRRLGFDFEKTSFEAISDRFIDAYKAGVTRCSLHAGAVPLLRDLKRAGVSQSVLSAAHEQHLNQLLDHFGILDIFDRVFGRSDTHGEGKIERGRDLLDASGFRAADSILIGDTDHDLDVGRALGVDVLLLGGGHQSYERLRLLHDRLIPPRRR